jgi:lipopolysaccharide assembly protein A
MKILTNLLTSLILAFWITLIGVVSIQNITEISLQFLWFKSISFPLGVLLTFAVGLGLIMGAFLPLFLSKNKPKRKKVFSRQSEEEILEYQREPDPIEDWDEFDTENW